MRFITLHIIYFPPFIIVSCKFLPNKISNFFALGGPRAFPSQSNSPFNVTLNAWRRGLVAFASTLIFGNISSIPPINCFALRLYVDQLMQCSKTKDPLIFSSFLPLMMSGSKLGRLPLLFFFLAGIFVLSVV